MAQNARQIWLTYDVKTVNEIDLTSIKSQLQENAQQIATLTTLMSKFVGNESKAKVCGICFDFSHSTDACPTVQSENVNALGGFSGQPQRKYDPFSPTYNEGWRDHPNLRYGHKPQFTQANPRPFVHQNPQSQPSNPSLEDLVKQLTTQIGQVHNQNIEYQKKTDSHLQQLDTQIGQICTSLSNIENHVSGKLPSQPLQNPSKQVNAISLERSTIMDEPLGNLNEDEVNEIQGNRIPLLDAIKVVPKYSKLLNDFLTTSNKHKGEEVLTPLIMPPPKCEDPGSFSIPCRICETIFRQCVLDLGSAVNVLPLSLYDKYKMGPLKTCSEILTMADGSSVCSVGLLENILVQVKHMCFLVDFIVINVMHNSEILLGRPFLKTSKALIDVAHNCVTLESNGEKLKLNVFEQDGST
ncbi:uncharacterized protein LOC104897178 [Beta vulgaris subsp. vulgaris]|uniref:uncharacterized protein LOC104897178 n=1 Tax=Beta vulgaris subsp. vulgaris TaxID=3555 RepID=UPI002549868F|nr:uncharacterized protein LOC104897178 [Beta vulgaris subsp. vulgaris]